MTSLAKDPKASRRWAGIALRILVAVVLLGLIFRKVDYRLVLQELAHVNGSWFCAAIVLTFLGQVLQAVKWRYLLAGGERLTLSYLVRLTLVGMFFNNFLPTSIGGDVIRFVILKRRKIPGPDVAVSLLMLRFMGILFLAFGVLGSLWPLYDLMAANGLLLPLGGASLLILIFPFILYQPAIYGLLTRLLTPLPRLQKYPQLIFQALHYYVQRKDRFGKALGVNAVYYFLNILIFWATGKALGLDIPFHFHFVLFGVMSLAAMIPLSLNGIGLREGATVVFFKYLSLDGHHAVAFSFTIYILLLLIGIGGGVVFSLDREMIAGKHASDGPIDSEFTGIGNGRDV